MTAEREAELLVWLRGASGPDHDRSVQHAILQGGEEGRLLARAYQRLHPQPKRSPNDKVLMAPNIK